MEIEEHLKQLECKLNAEVQKSTRYLRTLVRAKCGATLTPSGRKDAGLCADYGEDPKIMERGSPFKHGNLRIYAFLIWDGIFYRFYISHQKWAFFHLRGANNVDFHISNHVGNLKKKSKQVPPEEKNFPHIRQKQKLFGMCFSIDIYICSLYVCHIINSHTNFGISNQIGKRHPHSCFKQKLFWMFSYYIAFHDCYRSKTSF